MADTCAHPACNSRAPWGYRLPGLLSEQARRGYLWVCDEHREWAEEKRKKAMRLK